MQWYAEDGFWKMEKAYDLDETSGLTKLMTLDLLRPRPSKKP